MRSCRNGLLLLKSNLTIDRMQPPRAQPSQAQPPALLLKHTRAPITSRQLRCPARPPVVLAHGSYRPITIVPAHAGIRSTTIMIRRGLLCAAFRGAALRCNPRPESGFGAQVSFNRPTGKCLASNVGRLENISRAWYKRVPDPPINSFCYLPDKLNIASA